MNGRDFFSKEDFQRYKSACEVEKELEWEKHEVKSNGNIYYFDVHSGRYVNDNKYFISFFFNYNYKNEFGRRVGGGNVCLDITQYSDYESFINRIDESLERYEDYEKPKAIQMSLF